MELRLVTGGRRKKAERATSYVLNKHDTRGLPDVAQLVDGEHKGPAVATLNRVPCIHLSVHVWKKAT